MYSTILVALDGSAQALAGGRLAVALAGRLGCAVVASHVYDTGIHTTRFRDMEPGLPAEYRGEDRLGPLRDSHGSLITEGFHALSHGYLDDFLAAARRAGVAATEAVAEGRNYASLLELAASREAGLIALGAQGLGDVGDGLLGSTALRVLRRAPGDVLVARGGGDGPVVAGVDGSQDALAAARAAAAWAQALGRPLHLAAAFDPDFHVRVFQAMGRSLSPERQAEVGLDKQEALHHQFIDEGLATLYRQFLDEAVEHLASVGVDATAALLRGKAYRALVDHGRELGASLLAVGRFGHHRGDADIGSQAEAVARLAPCSVLVAGVAGRAAAGRPAGDAAAEAEPTVEWDADALARLDRIPSFARPMARRAIEDHVRSRGGARVTIEDVREAGRRMGMGGDRAGEAPHE